jgi:hypothetical protein
MRGNDLRVVMKLVFLQGVAGEEAGEGRFRAGYGILR